MSELFPDSNTKLKHRKSWKHSCRCDDALQSPLTSQPCSSVTLVFCKCSSSVPFGHNSTHFPIYAVFTQFSCETEMSISKRNRRHSTWAVWYNWTLKPEKDDLHFKEKEQNHLIYDVLSVWTVCVDSFTILSQRSRDNLLGDDWFWSWDMQHDKSCQFKGNCFLITISKLIESHNTNIPVCLSKVAFHSFH